MKSTKEQHLFKSNQPSESPHIFQERQSSGSEVQHISPIQNANWRKTTEPYSQINEIGKVEERTQRRQQKAQVDDHYIELDAPNTLVKEFYNKPLAQRIVDDGGFSYEEYEEEECLQKEQQSVKEKNIQQTSERFGKQSLSKGSNIQKIENPKLKTNECTDFDLTAKEISNKRFDKGKIKQVVGGVRNTSSPGEGAQSNSDTVKWAFSNKDSQETQKKISVINRETNQARDLIQKALKAHDSKANNQQPVNSNSIKGKILDFENLDSSSKNIDSGLYFNSNEIHKKYLSGTIDIDSLGKNDREGRIISFSEEEEAIMNSKHNYNSNRNGYVSATSKKGFNMKKAQICEAFQNIIDNTMDCPLCNNQKVYDSSLNCSKIEETKSRSDIIIENLEKKYLTSREYYNVKIINDIIYNENTHIVSVFKDYLIYDDVSEFLKRFYHKYETVQRLPKMFEFYEKYSKVFPNYVSLPESKYMFKNIERKQRLYDEKQRIVMEQQEREERKANGDFVLGNSADKKGGKHKDRFSSQNNGEGSSNLSQLSGNRMFDTKFIDSVANIKPSGFIEDSMQSSKINSSRLQEHVINSSLLIHQHLHENMENAKRKKKKKEIEELDMGELISKFIAKDTQSQIQSSQSSIMPEPQTLKPQPHAIQKKPIEAQSKNKPIYEYQEQKNIQPPSNIQSIQSESSKSIVDNSQRPTSSKQGKYQQQDSKRLSNGHQKQSAQEDKPLKEQIIVNDPNIGSTEGKILNYNICNNYNQYLCPNHEFLPQNHFINNENFFIPPPDIQPEQIKAQVAQTQKASSLQRNQSKSNLHTVNSAANENCQTPLKNIARCETKTPVSGEGERRYSIENKLQKRMQPETINQQEYFSQGINLLQDQKNMIAILFLNNQQQQQQLQDPSSAINEKQVMSPVNVTAKIPPQKIKASQVQVLSRETSHQSQKQINQNQPSTARDGQNQMFKNEMLASLSGKQEPSINLHGMSHDQEYTISSQGQGNNNNARSVEKLKLIEEEIEKDYSKYVNEYGLTKTAFAKAVNAIREKNNSVQSMQSMQGVSLTTRQSKLNSNEKQRILTNIRSSSTSQQRKATSGTRPIFSKIQGQETASDLYLNTNKNQAQKQIRTVRAKTHINSQNSSNCNQLSQRLSPDKNFLGSTSNNYGSTHNYIAFNQTSQRTNPPGTYVTLKAQPQKQAKGIKIKFPLNTQRGTQKIQGQGNTNISSNQTPKRIKLQKTKSTSNIPLCFTQRGVSQNFVGSSRGRGPNEMAILEQLNKESNSSIQQNFLRQSQNVLAHSGVGFGEQFTSQQDNILANQLYAQPTYASSQCGTYATTSILNSPLSFKGGQQQQAVTNKNQGKGRSSRNVGTSQQQSQKSIGPNHQRSGSNSGTTVLSSSNNKIKGKEQKRLSGGSNLSKKSFNSQTQQQVQNQASTSNIQQQILQLLMSYQQQNLQEQQQLDNTGLSNLQHTIPLSQTIKNLGNNSASMKDLKQIKNSQNYIIQDNQPIPTKNKMSVQGALIQQSQVAQKQGTSSILMVNQNFRKGTKSGKSTARADSKKRSEGSGPYQMNEGQSQTTNNQYTNASGVGPDMSSRFDSQYMVDNSKRILNFSKSQDNFDLIKLAAQRAALENQQQNNMLMNSTSSQAQQPFKFLQNLKQSESQSQLLKVKLAPQSQFTQQQSARSGQFDQNVLKQFRANQVSDYDSNLQSKLPTNIIIQTSTQIEKPTSRRTSGKFNPSSVKSNNQ